jgi:hypothetical protein
VVVAALALALPNGLVVRAGGAVLARGRLAHIGVELASRAIRARIGARGALELALVAKHAGARAAAGAAHVLLPSRAVVVARLAAITLLLVLVEMLGALLAVAEAGNVGEEA